MDGWVELEGKLDGELLQFGGKRVYYVAQGRSRRKILLVRTNTGLSCIDAVCGHAGGPLHEGDIENLGDQYWIRCPWHQYVFDVRSGKHVVEGCPREDFQRVHQVRVDPTTRKIFVKLSRPVFGQPPLCSDRVSVEPASRVPGRRACAGPAAAYRNRRLMQTKLGFAQSKNTVNLDSKPVEPAWLAAKPDSPAQSSPAATPWLCPPAGQLPLQSAFGASPSGHGGLVGLPSTQSSTAHGSGSPRLPAALSSNGSQLAGDSVGSAAAASGENGVVALEPAPLFSLSQESTSTIETDYMDEMDLDSDCESPPSARHQLHQPSAPAVHPLFAPRRAL